MEPKKRLIKIMGFFKRSHFEHSRRPAKGCRIVGITGTGRETEVTHLSIPTANCMVSALQRRTTAIERNDHGTRKTVKDVCQAGSVKQADLANYGYKIFGIAYYMQGNPGILASCLGRIYDKIIIDFGELRSSIRTERLRCEAKIVTAVLGKWGLEAFLEPLSEEEGCRAGWIYTAAFGDEDTRKQIEGQFGISLVRVPLSVDAFSVDYKTMQQSEGVLQRKKRQRGTMHENMSRKQLLSTAVRLSRGNRGGLIGMIRDVERGDRRKHQRIYLDGLKRYKNKGVRITIDGVECPEKGQEKIFEVGEDRGFYMGSYVDAEQGCLREIKFNKVYLSSPPKEKKDKDL